MPADQQTLVEPLLLNADQAAQALGVSRSKLYSMHSAGLLPLPVSLGGCVRWSVGELRAWVASGCPSREKWETIKETQDV